MTDHDHHPEDQTAPAWLPDTPDADPFAVRRSLVALLRESANSLEAAPAEAFALDDDHVSMSPQEKLRRTAVLLTIETVYATDRLSSAVMNSGLDTMGVLDGDGLARVHGLTRRTLSNAAAALRSNSFGHLVNCLAEGAACPRERAS